MNFTLAAALGLSLGQAPAADYFPLNSRNIKLPIEYKDQDRKAIRQVRLFVSTDKGNVWNQVAEVPPDRDAFVYSAPQDGIYWFNYQIIDLKGRPDLPNLNAVPPASKALIDTTPPQVRFTSARRNGGDVVVEWVIEDQYPDETKTRVYFRAAGSEGFWTEVTIHPSRRDAVQFPVSIPGPVVVKVAVQDLAGNKGEGLREVPAAGSNTQTTASLSPGPAASAAPGRPAGQDVPPPMDITPPGPVAPAGGPVAPTAPPVGPATQYQPAPPTTPVVPASPLGPTNPAAGAPPVQSAGQPNPIVMQPNPVVMQPSAAPPTGPVPAAVFQGKSNPTAPAEYPAAVPAAGHTPTPPGNPGAVAVWSGNTNPGPTVEVTRVQAINFLRFDLPYQVEQQGPSGVSRVDLWVTRDDGQSWVRWSQHDGRGGTIRVALDARGNAALEGLYGFRLVPVSGAGLSDREPTRGDAPEMRVIVDLTPPRIEWYPPAADPTDPGVLILQWRATDANFADDPISVEWSEKPTGPWVSVAAGSGDVVPALGGATGQRLPNTGRYPWRVPTGLPPRVYFRVTARDAAGNVQTGIDGPTLIDLAKPRARIVGPPTPRP
jgi:hypothetical protein